MEQHVVPREQKLASAVEGEEFKKNVLYQARRRPTTPLPKMWTVNAALVPQLVLRDPGGEAVHDAALVAFFVSQTLLERQEEMRKEKEEKEEQEDELQSQPAELLHNSEERGLGTAKGDVRLEFRQSHTMKVVGKYAFKCGIEAWWWQRVELGVCGHQSFR